MGGSIAHSRCCRPRPNDDADVQPEAPLAVSSTSTKAPQQAELADDVTSRTEADALSDYPPPENPLEEKPAKPQLPDLAPGQPEATQEETRFMQLLDSAYGDGSSRDDPAEWEGYCMVESVNQATTSALYGELLPLAFVHMVRHLGVIAGEDRFYDLGSGTGKLVILASLLGFQATGVELEPGRHRAACASRASIFQKENRARRDRGLFAIEQPRLVQASFLSHDFSDAGFIFVASVVFSTAMMEALAVTARKMKPGAKIVSYKPFPEPGFRTLGEMHLQVSWRADKGGTAAFQVQEVVQVDSSAADTP